MAFVQVSSKLATISSGGRLPLQTITSSAPKLVSSITNAINALPPEGGTITLEPGRWIYDYPLQIVNKNNVTVRGAEGGQWDLFRPLDYTTQNHIEILGSSNIVIEGFYNDLNYTELRNIVTPALGGSISMPFPHPHYSLGNGFVILGSTDVKLNGTITRAGAYAGWVGALNSDSNRILLNLSLENNRSILHGNAGSWAGGVFVMSNGISNRVTDLTANLVIDNCTGHGFWMYAPDVQLLNRDFKVDIRSRVNGLDVALFSVLDGLSGSVQGELNGWIGAVPRWNDGDINAYPVVADTAGVVKNVKNLIVSGTHFQGECLNADGANRANYEVYASNASPSDVEWNTYNYGNGGPNGAGVIARAVNISSFKALDPNFKGGYVKVFARGMNQASVVLAGAQNWTIDADLETNQTLLEPPIKIINYPPVLNSAGQIAVPAKVSRGNVITGRARYTGTYSDTFAILETPELAGAPAYGISDINKVINFEISSGLRGIFRKDPNSGSYMAQRHQSYGSSGNVPKDWYFAHKENVNDSTKTFLSLEYDGAQKGFLNEDVFNVGVISGAGAFATGNRSTIGVKDSMNSGVGLFSEFLANQTSAFTPARANLFDNTFGLMRIDVVDRKLKVSYNRDGSGARVWENIGAGDLSHFLELRAPIAGTPGIDFSLIKPDGSWNDFDARINREGPFDAGRFVISQKGSGVLILVSENGITFRSGTTDVNWFNRVLTVGGGGFGALRVEGNQSNAIYAVGGIDVDSMYSRNTEFNSISTLGGVQSIDGYFIGLTAVIDYLKKFYGTGIYIDGYGDVINNFGQFVGGGAVMGGGCSATGYGVTGGWFGQTFNGMRFNLISTAGETVSFGIRGGIITQSPF